MLNFGYSKHIKGLLKVHFRVQALRPYFSLELLKKKGFLVFNFDIKKNETISMANISIC